MLANLWIPGPAPQDTTQRRWSLFTIALLLALVAAAGWILLGGNDATKPNLQAQWIFVAVILTAFSALSGFLIKGRLDGILIDERNRVSLSRLQWITWFIILLGGYFTEAVWNSAHGGAYPTMQEELFILLGIVSASAITSNLIIDTKKTDLPTPPAQQLPGQPQLLAPAPPLQPGQPGQIGRIDCNATVAEASWADLFMGEEVANRNVVDISRLQKLVITVLLAITYIKLLWDVLGNTVAGVSDTKGAVLNMPPVNSTFLWLLGISHAAYLAYKATPKSGSSSTAANGVPQPPQPPADDAIDGCDVDFRADPTPDAALPGATGGVA